MHYIIHEKVSDRWPIQVLQVVFGNIDSAKAVADFRQINPGTIMEIFDDKERKVAIKGLNGWENISEQTE